MGRPELRIFFFACLYCIATSVSIVKRYPHDNLCYTQGFEFISDTQLVESCGNYGVSRVLIQELDRTNNQLHKINNVSLETSVFGEGVTLLNGKYYVLTWRERKIFLMDKQTLKVERIFRWARQGWGLTNNSTHLFVSDGTPHIFVLDAGTRLLKSISIKSQTGELFPYINELQFYKNGKILANVYMKNIIALIDPQTGVVEKTYDLASLQAQEQQLHELKRDEVLNGLAYNPTKDELLATGKHWKQVYQIKLEE